MAKEDYTGGTYSKLAEVTEQKQKTPALKPTPAKSPQGVSKDTTQPRNHDTVVPPYQDTKNADYVEIVRKAVKQLGKEAATYRFTQDEKRALADIVYGLKTKDIRSSENEITRIAINYLVWEYHHSKQSSILSRVLERLNA